MVINVDMKYLLSLRKMTTLLGNYLLIDDIPTESEQFSELCSWSNPDSDLTIFDI